MKILIQYVLASNLEHNLTKIVHASDSIEAIKIMDAFYYPEKVYIRNVEELK